MKLFIPTCTLNFNNIFSTESISPAAYYAKRDFGNKRFVKVEANGLDNVILLYSKYPHYEVDRSDMENSSLVFEIDSEDYPSDKFSIIDCIGGVDVYYSPTTIFFNPYHIKVYFQSYQDLQSTITKAEQSLENKYSKLYKISFSVRQEKTWSISNLFSEKDSFEWSPAFIDAASKISLLWTNSDYIVDKIKGAIVCYLIGANMSVSREVGRLKQLSRKMRNTLSSIVNSPNKKPTDIQDETLLSYIKEFNKIYSSLDDNSLYNKSIINQRLISPSTNLDKETLIKVLEDLHLEDAFKRQLNLRPIYDANELYSCLDSPTMSPTDAYTMVVERLFNAVRHIETKELSKTQKNHIKDLVTVDNNSLQIVDPLLHKGTYINKLLNSLIKNEYKQFMQENSSEELLSIAFVGGGILKDCMPDKWEGSEYQIYINGLLANMQQGEPFDLFSIDNVILQSFAAFCQKGEEVDRLTDYMLQCGFSDYRIALGIYGATRGFSSLPKTFTSSLIDGEKSYYTEFYRVLHKWLFGTEIQNIVFAEQDYGNHLEELDKPIPSMILGNINKIQPKQGKQESIVKAISKTASLEDAVQSPRAFMYILDSIPNMTKTKAYKILKAANFENDETLYDPLSFKNKIYSIIGTQALKGQKDKIDKAIELEAKRQDPQAFLFILDNFLKPTDSAYKKIANLLGSSQKIKEQSLFDNRATDNSRHTVKPINKTSPIFVEDINVNNYILSRQYLPWEFRDLLSKKVVQFQKGYAPGGKYFNDRTNNPTDNVATISHFENWCFYKGTYGSIIEKNEMNINLFKQLKEDLFKRYES